MPDTIRPTSTAPNHVIQGSGPVGKDDTVGSVRMADIDWDAAERTQDRVQNRSVIIVLVNDVANWTGAGELQDKGVHPGDMVGHKKKPAARQIFQTERSDAIKGTNQQPTKEIEGALGA